MRNCTAFCLLVLVLALGCSAHHTDAEQIDPMIDSIYKSTMDVLSDKNRKHEEIMAEAEVLTKSMLSLKLERKIAEDPTGLPQAINLLKDKHDFMGKYNDVLKQRLAVGQYEKLREFRKKYNYQQYIE